MKQIERVVGIPWLMVVLASVAGASTAAAQTDLQPPPGRSESGPALPSPPRPGMPRIGSGEVARLQTDLEAARAQLQAAESQFATGRTRVQQGLASQSELVPYEAEVRKWRGIVTGLEAQLTQRRLYQMLARPVDVRLRDAPLPEAAQVISQASGLSVTVDPALPSSSRVTTTATGVPVAEVLGLLARNTQAQIAPAADARGVVLRPVPTLEIDGVKREFPGPAAPWSPEWNELTGPPLSPDGVFIAGQRFGAPGQGGFGGGGFGGFGGGFGGFPGGAFGGGGFAGGGFGGFPGVGPGPGVPAQPGQPGMPSPMQPMPGGMFPTPPEDTPLAVTAIGSNRFIVATRGFRPTPAPGLPGGMRPGPVILLSLYEIEGGRMRRVSTIVHEPGPVPGFPQPGAPMAPAFAPGAPGPRPRPGLLPMPGRGPAPIPRPSLRPPGAPEPRPQATPEPPREGTVER